MSSNTIAEPITFFEDKVISIKYHPDSNCIENTWNGFANSDTYRANMNKILEAFKKHKADSIMGDVVNMKVVSVADQKWTNEVWQPEILKAGFKRNAIVVSGDIFNKITVEKIVNSTDNNAGVEYKYFSQREKAFAWLRGE
ncbi:STAS/SEC14 domain-containing protein [Chondrinema litorale]|uniref:STAS/SEC14 domain-containing protein n=1 Tax=Chondrinema litorale TaxID=2994555 RepID=UPI00254342EB|nr:STAS/SEC14 domain-containing protein [Chondrinema litorale]UZR96924.1 STAS/SEC14 domain-containing protein [Chondrinema litorale]